MRYIYVSNGKEYGQTSICPANHDYVWRLQFPPYCVKHRIAGFLSGLHDEVCYTYKGVTWTWEVKDVVVETY